MSRSPTGNWSNAEHSSTGLRSPASVRALPDTEIKEALQAR